ncbi:hypothetical protein CLOLEP_00111 [[Clostridium] leptum DSM 753]|uniref:Uncharacterized protein n=1 Tax=[Clostridium] leptum DSM 753 TaxID=428125 RepID=A7VNI6_9FIRM|nr:hypothetical protein CLOLEP_00111 [[Clostridium] leptum DSM 753]
MGKRQKPAPAGLAKAEAGLSLKGRKRRAGKSPHGPDKTKVKE